MYENKLLPKHILDDYNFKDTKLNVDHYFEHIEKMEWQYEKLNCLRGLTAKYDLTCDNEKRLYSPIGKDIFNISAKECTEEKLKQIIYTFNYALDNLEEVEKKFIKSHYRDHKSDDEVINELGLINLYSDSYEYRHIKRSAIIRFASFLGVEVEKS